MIPHPRFPVEPWFVRETALGGLDTLAASESMFALSNGHIGVRGNLDEGDPHGLPGTYLNSFYETRPLPYAEAGYGYPESGQSVLNVTNGKLIRLLVDDEPFDMRYGEILQHERVLDFRAGTLFRLVDWVSPAGARVRVRSTRLVSLTHRSLMAINYEVEAVDAPVRIVLQSELVANEDLPPQSRDPRVAAVLEHALEAVQHSGADVRALLIHRTAASRLQLAAGMDHEIGQPWRQRRAVEVAPDHARVTVSAELAPEQRAGLTKYVAYGWSGLRTTRALQDQVDAALVTAIDSGWERLAAEQREALDEFWQGADVVVEGSPAIQQAVRFSLFHAFQAAARAERRAIPAKGLTGPGYDGHAFWDTESFVVPLLIATAPGAAADALRWRHSTLPLARERAVTLRQQGACFPWRTIRGHECSAYWPAGSAAAHVNADIAIAAARYVHWTGDHDFERDHALELLVETARFWASLGHHGADGHFHIDGVTGPDEYSALGDDNVYTNLMAARNMRAAAEAVRRWPDQAAGLAVTEAEVTDWLAAAEVISVPVNESTGVHEQDRGYTGRAVWDFAASAAAQEYPLLLHAPYSELYRRQVVKQADLVLALHWCGDSFTAEQKARDFAYYEPLTVRDSSLSSSAQAIIAAEVGQLELATDYLAESGLMDLGDLEHNTRDGLHIAALAGTWLAVVCGFGGLRDHGPALRFAPQLPVGWQRLAFGVRWRGSRIHVDVRGGSDADGGTEDGGGVRYQVVGDRVQIVHVDELIELRPGEPVVRPLHHVPPSTPRPSQPPGREPLDATTLLER